MIEDSKKDGMAASQNTYALVIEGPVYLTVNGGTQELIVKAFSPVLGGAAPVPVHLHFTNEAFGELAGGIMKLIDLGHVTVNAGTPNQLQ